ncbi:MAG: DUF4240 domain-containing protein [Oscillochloris sp.]|nr:DUF4240 domain-containing protein [Oscillochloris sp.]
MNPITVWMLITASQRHASGDPEQQVAWLADYLSTLDAAAIIAFEEAFTQLVRRAAQPPLRAVAHRITGVLSEDRFEVFCAGLIAQGYATYAAALRDPETLIGTVDPTALLLEPMLSVAAQAYARKTGTAIADGW